MNLWVKASVNAYPRISVPNERFYYTERAPACQCRNRNFVQKPFTKGAAPSNEARLPDCRKTLGELERAKALSNFNRAQRHVRWAREDFCGGKSHFPEQKSFPCSFCARKSERFQQKLVGVAGRLKTQRVFRFRRRRNCRRLKPKI